MDGSDYRETFGRAASLLVHGALTLGAGPLGIVSFVAWQLPIWRLPGRQTGVPLMDYIYGMWQEVRHIPIDQARREAYWIYEGVTNAKRVSATES